MAAWLLLRFAIRLPEYQDAAFPVDNDISAIKGIPASTRMALPQRLPRQEPKTEVVSPSAARSGDSMKRAWLFVNVPVTVVSQGQRVAGASVVGRWVSQGRSVRNLFHQLSSASTTNERGEISTLPIAYREDSPDDSPMAIASFHPGLGTAYEELSLVELRNAGLGDIVLKLDERNTLTGRVLDEAGSPLASADVVLRTANPVEGISLSGLTVYTDSDGLFTIPGIGFDNIPRGLDVSWRLPGIAEGTILTGTITVRLTATIQESAFWDVGDLLVSNVRQEKVVTPEAIMREAQRRRVHGTNINE